VFQALGMSFTLFIICLGNSFCATGIPVHSRGVTGVVGVGQVVGSRIFLFAELLLCGQAPGFPVVSIGVKVVH
jgi:hypothetical protein